MRILSKYIFGEYVGNLVLGLIIFTFVLVVDRIFDIVDLVLTKGIGWWLALKMFILLLPASLSLTLPMSVLLAALLTYGHLSEVNEITAMRASGMAPWSYLQVPIYVALSCVIFLIPFNTVWAPHAHSHFRHLYVQVLQKNPLVRIEPKTFSRVGDYHVYVEKKEKKSNAIEGVTIYKTSVENAPLRIFAARGQASVDPNKGLTLILEDGHIEEIDPRSPERWFYTAFKTYRLEIPFEVQGQAWSRTLQEMDNYEIRSQIKELKAKGDPYPLLSCERHLRWALSMTPLLFAILGIPLAIRVQRGGRSIGVGLSLVILVGYYAMTMGGVSVGQRGIAPAFISVWIGNIALLGVGIFFSLRFLRR